MTKSILTDPELERQYVAAVVRFGDRGHLLGAERLASSECAVLQHGHVLEAAYRVALAGEPVSELAVRAALEREEEAQGALAALRGLATATPWVGPLDPVAGTLRRLAAQRRARDLLLKGVAEAERGHLEGAQEYAREAVGVQGDARVEVLSLHACARLAMSANAQQRRGNVRTGFDVLDGAIRAMPPRTMAVVGGRTGCGKSTLMLRWALNLARSGHRPGIVSLEDSAEVWGTRALAHVTDANPARLLSEQLGFDSSEEAARGLAALERAGVKFTSALNKPLADVLRAVRALGSEHACDVIFVDYLQAIRLGAGGKRFDRLVSDAAQQLKAECQAQGAVLVLGSQVGRPDNNKPFAPLTIYSLKESGDLENMSEVVLLLWKTSDDDSARIVGRVGKVKWSGRRPSFELQLNPHGALQDVVHYTEPRLPGEDNARPRRFEAS